MRKYRASAATQPRLDYGLEVIQGLELFPETAPLAADFAELNDELETAENARKAKRKPLVKARLGLRLANYETDQAIKTCGKAAEIADGGRRGPVFGVLFPKGVGPVIAPAGARQIKPTEALADRLGKSKNPAVIAFAQEWTPKLEAVLNKLRAADVAHKSALKEHGGAFLDELARREEHSLSVDRLMGQVRAAFPGDRAKQDLIFPVPEEGGNAEGNAEAESEESPDAPAPAGPSAGGAAPGGASPPA